MTRSTRALTRRRLRATPVFENTPMEVMKSSRPSKESVVGAANQDFPDYEPLSGDRRDEDKMLSLEDLYPCRFGSVASLSMRTRERKRSTRSRSEGSCVNCFSPFHRLFWL